MPHGDGFLHWLPKVCGIFLRLLMVVDAQVETLDRVVVSLIGALDTWVT
jgi:hypothetical protein